MLRFSRIPYLSYDYILRLLIKPFLSGVIFISFILVMFQVLRLTNFAIVHGVSMLQVLRVFFYMLISFLPMAIPISFLFSVLFVFGQLSMDNEMVAFRSAGFSLLQLFIPVFFVSVLVAFFSLRITFYEAPRAYQNVKKILQDIGSRTVSLSIKPGFFNTDMIDSLVFYAESVRGNSLSEVFIYDSRDKSMPISIYAKDAILRIDKDTARTEISLHNGKAIFGLDKPSVMSFKEYNALLFEGQKLSKLNLRLHYLDIKQLENVIRKNPSPKARTEYYKRYAIALSSIIFAFIGILFGNFTGRSGKSVSLISFGFVLLYWVFYLLGTSLGANGSINPFLGAWLANVSFIFIAVVYWKKKSFVL